MTHIAIQKSSTARLSTGWSKSATNNIAPANQGLRRIVVSRGAGWTEGGIGEAGLILRREGMYELPEQVVSD